MESNRREEIRGIFTLSLLALFLVIRTNYDKLGINPLLRLPVPFTSYTLETQWFALIDVVIFFWGAYAFCMILSFSDDIIRSSRIRAYFSFLGAVFLILGPLLFAGLFATGLLLAYFFIFFPNSLYILLGLLFVIILTALIFRKYSVKIVVESKEKRASKKEENK